MAPLLALRPWSAVACFRGVLAPCVALVALSAGSYHGTGMLEKSTQMADHLAGFSKLTRPAGDLRFLQRDDCGVDRGRAQRQGLSRACWAARRRSSSRSS